MPQGHTLTEYVWHCYGRNMYLFTLAVILFYAFAFSAAKITGMALIASLVAGILLWVALIVAVATLHTRPAGNSKLQSLPTWSSSLT